MTTFYQRQARETPAYAWWKLPVAGLLAVVFWLGATIAMIIVAAIVFEAADRPDAFDKWFDAAGDLDLTHLDYFTLDMLGLVTMIPAVLLAVLVTGPRPIGYLTSVAGRMRWRWLGRTTVMAFTVFIVTLGATLLVSGLLDPEDVQTPSSISPRIVFAILLILLLTPFQAAAEEYVFRGYVMQLVGSWTRFAVVPVIVSVPLFVAGHAYELWGLVDVGIFGLTAAILVVRTGGLEASIAAHTANNVVLLVLDAFGVISATDDSAAGPVELVPTVVSSVVLLVWVEWAVRRHGIQRTRAPLPVPLPPPAPMWPPPPYALPPQQWAPIAVAPPLASPVPSVPPALHPTTPPYPGELPDGWSR